MRWNSRAHTKCRRKYGDIKPHVRKFRCLAQHSIKTPICIYKPRLFAFFSDLYLYPSIAKTFSRIFYVFCSLSKTETAKSSVDEQDQSKRKTIMIIVVLSSSLSAFLKETRRNSHVSHEKEIEDNNCSMLPDPRIWNPPSVSVLSSTKPAILGSLKDRRSQNAWVLLFLDQNLRCDFALVATLVLFNALWQDCHVNNTGPT